MTPLKQNFRKLSEKKLTIKVDRIKKFFSKVPEEKKIAESFFFQRSRKHTETHWKTRDKKWKKERANLQLGEKMALTESGGHS